MESGGAASRAKTARWGFLLAAACLSVFAASESDGHSQAACGPLDRHVALYNVTFCVAQDAGYEIRSADPDRIRFEEVRWVDGKRASLDEFKEHRLSNKNGNDVSVAVITSIVTESVARSLVSRHELDQTVFAAVTAHQEEFLHGSAVSFEVSSWCGRQKFQFEPESEVAFVASVEPEFAYFCSDMEYWIVGTNYSGIEALLRCFRAKDSELSCLAEFDVGQARALVSIFGKSVRHLIAAYKENRSNILSFLAS